MCWWKVTFLDSKSTKMYGRLSHAREVLTCEMEDEYSFEPSLL